MEMLCSAVLRIAVMALVAAVAELLVPEGTLRNTVSIAAGLTFISEAAMEILRIFRGIGG